MFATLTYVAKQHNGNSESQSELPGPHLVVRKTGSSHNLPTPSQAKDRKRKRSQEATDSLYTIPANATRKRLQTSHPDSVVKHTSDEEAACTVSGQIDPIDHWRRKGTWPAVYFEQDDQTREYFNRDLDEESWIRKYWIPNMENVTPNIGHVLARKKSSSSLRGKQSDSSAGAPSSTPAIKSQKSAQYLRPSYATVLATKGSFMDKSDLGITDESKNLCRMLLENEQIIPQGSLFRDDLFDKTCRKIQDKNEARIIQDIARLIVPSAETLATCGATNLELLVESVNEGWNSSIPVTKPRPQPDYSVGFRREAFTDKQLSILEPFVGNVADIFTSYFMATWYMYFPFLTCEVKCGAAALDIADRQNAHSMTLAVRGIVEFFKLVNRQKELHREILAFSISHDHRAVRIYGHYPVIDGGNTTFYRHPVHTFDFTALDGKEKWTAYKFTKKVYDLWMPKHFERICSVIDELPKVNFELSQQSELDFPGGSGLSQELEDQHLSQQSNAESTSLEEHDGQSSVDISQGMTSNTTPSQETEQGTFKVPKKTYRRVAT